MSLPLGPPSDHLTVGTSSLGLLGARHRVQPAAFGAFLPSQSANPNRNPRRWCLPGACHHLLSGTRSLSRAPLFLLYQQRQAKRIETQDGSLWKIEIYSSVLFRGEQSTLGEGAALLHGVIQWLLPSRGSDSSWVLPHLLLEAVS